MLSLILTADERVVLETLERRGEPAHLREKAHALLLVADGHCATTVARSMLWRPRRAATVRGWVHAYKANGTEGLKVKEGRGRKSLLFRPTT